MRGFALVSLLVAGSLCVAAEPASPRKIVLIAGKKSHGPGAHDYERTMRLFKVMLDNSNVADHVRIEIHENGWPADESTLDDADTVVFYSDGRDGDKFVDVPFVRPERMKVMQKQMDRGCGMMTMHFSTFATDEEGKSVLQWTGGYFDWQDDAGKANWYSKISQIETLELAARDHAIGRGVPRMVQLRDEVYWKLRFLPADKRLTPIWRAIDVKDADPTASTVAWAIERADGGRGFGTSVGHGYRLWQDEGIRKLFLNAICWTAKVAIPEVGVESRFYTDDQVKLALAGVKGSERAVVETPIRVLMLTGNKNHAWHKGEKSTPRVQAALEADSRIQVEVTSDIEDLAKKKLSDYQTIVLNNYANWQDPNGLSEPAKQAFLRYLKGGGGLVVIHFANGAFHYSLPEAGESDWPEYRKIVRRVWDHHGREGAKSGHDAFGRYTVDITPEHHPITTGLKSFEVADELYYNQAGSEPIMPLITAKSKDTKRDEPLAFAYQYDEARVFQTLLGHSEQTYDSYEPREMLRRAVAWVARRKVLPLSPEQEKLTLSKLPPVALADGKYGKALDAVKGGMLLTTKAADVEPPLTVECWAKLDNKEGFNILVASEEKSAATHWELYSYAGSGMCSVYLPGRGGEYKTGVDICDGKWHHVGFALGDETLQIYVDAKLQLDGAVPKPSQKATAGAIGIGRLVEGTIGCAGLIDDVRIRRETAKLDAVPDKPLVKGNSTSLLISFDDQAELAKLQAAARNVPKPTVELTKPDHWGIEGVGFKWKEEDSRDDRWKDANIGRFLASSLPLGTAAGTVAKGLSIRLGEKQNASVCYDTEHCKLRAAWTGGFLKFTAARYGLIMPPLMDGEPQFLATETPGWAAKEIRYRGMRLAGERVVLQYDVDGVRVEESPDVNGDQDARLFKRQIEIGPSERELTLRVAGKLTDSDAIEMTSVDGLSVAVLRSGGQTIAFATLATDAHWHISEGRELQLTIAPHQRALAAPLFIGNCGAKLEPFAQQVKGAEPLGTGKGPQLAMLNSSKPLWPEEITTSGKMAANDAGYVIDTITVPFENPYKALFFTSGHDFVSPETMAVCTVHGDVWLVSGVGEKLEQLHWKRFATGLFQPLGLVAKKEGIYVLGRDQITLLKDSDHNQEADLYECFSNQYPTSPSGHDYTTCLETDANGNFYFITAKQGIWRLSADGKSLDNLVGGLRNPNGLGVGYAPVANGERELVITAAPQEGEWTPASYIAEAKPGDWFGYGGPKVTPERPLGWTQPLCFIPRRRDNSSGGQVWASSDRWGPLKDQLLHFSYGQCRPMLVLREVINGQPQGGTVDMPQLLFDSGAMRGRISPYDGQLYVTGLRGWTTAATQDGCLQRVRYSGKAVHMPIKFRTLQNGVAITFSEPLQRDAAQDVENYHLEQWNYRYAASYGSPDLKVSDPKQEGHDVVRLESATLLADDRTVFLEIKDLKPVNQLTVGYALTAASGDEFRHTIAYTIHNLNSERMDPAKLNRASSPGRLSETVEKSLRPGLKLRLSHGDSPRYAVSRMAALLASHALQSGANDNSVVARFEGYLQVPLKGEYDFAVHAKGESWKLWINGQPVANGEGKRVKVTLHGGYNELRLDYTGGPFRYDADLKLLWARPGEMLASIPPSALFHRGDDPELATGEQFEHGQQLFESRNCHRCHELVQGSKPAPSHAPNRIEVGKRFRRDWLAAWILEPSKLRNHPRMPRLLDPAKPEDRQTAANVAAFLSGVEREQTPEPPEEEVFLKGRDLFEDLGCVTCHRLTPPAADDEFNRVSLHFINAKFTPENLKRYLRAPQAHFSLTRMPDFKLQEAELEALAAYLRKSATGIVQPLPELAQADGKAGAIAEQKLRCNACHTPQDAGENPPRTAIAHVQSDCLAPENAARHAAAPTFVWQAGEREALIAYLDQRDKSLGFVTPAMVSQQLYHELRCAACHRRDGDAGPRLAILDAESEHGLTPEVLPDLTWAGEKLQTRWIERQIAGELPQRVRPWLKARMPAFPGYAEELAQGLAAEHGVTSDGNPPQRNPEAAKIGEQLTLKENLDCRQCHAIGDLQPTGDEKTRLAPGINFADIGQRLRYDYYQRFVLDPPRWDVTSRMPQLAPDGKTTKVISFYDGDAAKQFEALWQYIQSVKGKQ
jgi:type 1 glutamine amidotransferase/cytochrome c2